MSTANNKPAESETPSLPSASEAWLEKNLKTLMLVVVVVIVAIAAAGVVRYRTDAVAREAGAAFTSAKTVEELDAVISKYPGSLAEANALLQKAELLWENNQKDSSTTALKKFLESHGKHPLAAQAKLGLASKLDAMGEKAEAKKQFEELVSQYADSEVTPLAEIRLGDLLWADGKTEEAKAIYAALPSKYPGTNQPFFDQSQERLKWVGAALPTKEVDAPPAPEKKPEEAPALGTVTVPPIKLGGPGAATPPMRVTVTPDGVATTPAVEVKPSVEPPVPVPAPAPAAPKPAPTPDDSLKLEVPASKPDATPKAEAPEPAPVKPQE